MDVIRAFAPLAVTLLLLGCQPAPERPVAAVSSPLAEQLDSYLASRDPSGAFLFAVGDEVVLERGYGEAASDAVFPLGSVTKQFTAAAILQLAQRGKLSLNDDLGALFGAVPDDKAAIKVQQLLAHNSGLARNVGDVYDYIPPEEFRERLFAAPLDFEPGTRHVYSNSGYILLGQIVAKVSGLPLGDYFERHLLRPAGLTRTGYPGPRFAGAAIPRGYDRPKYKEVYPGTPMEVAGEQDPRFQDGAGGLLSTVSDLYRWERALLGGRILAPAWLEQMTSPHGIITADGKYRYGYAWVIQDTEAGEMLWHNGVWYSYFTEVLTVPSLDVIAVGFTNRQQDETFDETFNAAARQLIEAARQRSPTSSPERSAEAPAAARARAR